MHIIDKIEVEVDCCGELGGHAEVDYCGDCVGWCGVEYAGFNDSDNDLVCDDVDNCIDVVNTDQSDVDTDQVGDLCDNCVEDANTDQSDCDEDDLGDVCDADADNDGALNEDDTDDCDPYVCSDTDQDTCDDCSGGSYDPFNDGLDSDLEGICCLLYTSPSPRDGLLSRMPSSA